MYAHAQSILGSAHEIRVAVQPSSEVAHASRARWQRVSVVHAPNALAIITQHASDVCKTVDLLAPRPLAMLSAEVVSKDESRRARQSALGPLRAVINVPCDPLLGAHRRADHFCRVTGPQSVPRPQSQLTQIGVVVRCCDWCDLVCPALT